VCAGGKEDAEFAVRVLRAWLDKRVSGGGREGGKDRKRRRRRRN